MSTEARGSVTYEAIVATAFSIARRGELPTTTLVRAELGRGSNTTVAKHLTRWAKEFMPKAAGALGAPTLSTREREAIELFRTVLSDEAAAQFASHREAADARVAAAEAERDAALDTAGKVNVARDRAEERALGLEAGLAALSEQLAISERARSDQDERISRMQAATTEAARQYEDAVASLREQMAQALERSDGMQKHMLMQIEHARAAHADARKRLEDDLSMASARQQRTARDLDRVRGEREAFESRALTAEAELKEARAAGAAAEQRADTAELRVVAAEERAAAADARVAALVAQVGQLVERMAVGATHEARTSIAAGALHAPKAP